MANQSIKAAFERLWQHTVLALSDKADKKDIAQSDWNQENENSPDFIKNKPELITKEYVDTAVSNIAVEVDKTLTEENKAADAKAVGDAIKQVEENALNNGVAILAETQKSVDALAASIQYLTATDDGNGIVTLGFGSFAPASEVTF